MVSLKRLLGQEKDEPIAPSNRAVTLLLEGVALQAVNYNLSDLELFQARMRRLRNSLEETPDPASTVAIVGEAITLGRNHNSEVEKSVRAMSHAWYSMVALASNTLLAQCEGQEATVRTLRCFEKELENASQFEDIRQAQAKIAECIAGICTEVERQREIARQLAPNADMEQLTKTKPPDFDASTGLPGRSEAEAAIVHAIETNKSAHMGVFCVERVEMVSQKYGFSAGEQALLVFSQHLAQKLDANDSLYRWRGPSFVALLSKRGSLDLVRAELTKLTGTRLQHEILVGNRSVLLPISVAWTAFPLTSGQTVEDIRASIDSYLSKRIPVAK
jgi:GGDEF domain-containing protein